jgi:HK97 family phage major capsid protein
MPQTKQNLEIVRLREQALQFNAEAKKILKEFEGKELPEEKRPVVDELLAKGEDVLEQVKRLQRAEDQDEALNAPAHRPAFYQPAAEEEDEEMKAGPGEADKKLAKMVGPFRSLGDELKAIHAAKVHNIIDPRFEQMGNQLKALGSNEQVMSEGGFLLQPTFGAGIWKRAYETGQILSRCSKVTAGANSNGFTLNAINETSRATGSRWGGVRAYWAGPGVAGTPTKPTFRQVELKLKKLICLGYATDELLQDATLMTSVYNQAFAEEIQWMVEEAIVNGLGGVNEPLGVRASGAVIEVAKEGAQVADTVVAPNISKMWARMWARSRPDAAWFITQDVEAQLDLMAVTVGLGGMPVYMPPNGIADLPFGRMKGRPVIVTEHNQALGDAGDIALVDFSQYLCLDKGDMQSASSIHVAFLTDETAFRLTYRFDGKPIWNAVLTPAKGSTLSPYITLAERA